MSQSTTTSATTREVVHDSCTDVGNGRDVCCARSDHRAGGAIRHPGGHVATKGVDPHRWIDAIRVAAGSLHLPPPRQHYPTDTGYLERSRMAREMDRL